MYSRRTGEHASADCVFALATVIPTADAPDGVVTAAAEQQIVQRKHRQHGAAMAPQHTAQDSKGVRPGYIAARTLETVAQWMPGS